MARFIVEGHWSGYSSGQARVCHRQVFPANRKKFVEKVRKIHTIGFTDGTTMSISVRTALPREKVTEVKGYTELIADAVYADKEGFVTVAELRNLQPFPAPGSRSE